MPPLRALVLVLKALLREARMNEVVDGGLSSYSTTLMVIAYLLQQGYRLADRNSANPPLPPNNAPQDLGHLLIGFLDRFVRRFNYTTEAVSVERVSTP
jgi:DNA polymerase sigma